MLRTKDYDFGSAGVRKKIYKVYVSFKGDGRNVYVDYGVNGGTCNNDFATSSGGPASDKPLTNAGTGSWTHAELYPATTGTVSSIYSFQLQFQGSGTAIASDFEINDITVIYRAKTVN